MILLLIRHGESEADILHVHEGRAGFPLTARGHRQALSMAKAVSARYSVTHILPQHAHPRKANGLAPVG